MFENAPPSVVGCRSIRNGMTAGLESEYLVGRDSAVPDARCRRLVGHRRSPAVWLRCLCLFVHNRFHKFYSFIHYSPQRRRLVCNGVSLLFVGFVPKERHCRQQGKQFQHRHNNTLRHHHLVLTRQLFFDGFQHRVIVAGRMADGICC